MNQPSTDKPRHTALGLLARREHSYQELEYKLLGRGFASKQVETLLQELTEQDLLSNTRFTEEYIHSRIRKGFGPNRISVELRDRGIGGEEIRQGLAACGVSWSDQVIAARHQRFGVEVPEEYKERAKQMRFLQQRGFTQDQIRNAFEEPE